MPKKLPFSIEKCILCEDVREEKSGKHTLVGVYAGDILISAIPGNMSLALYLEVSVTKRGKAELSMKISGPGSHESILKAKMNFDKRGVAVLATPRIDLLVDTEGTFNFDISSDEKVWENVVSKKINLNSALASASPPPS